MKTSNYRVVPLPSEMAEAARRAANAGAQDHAVLTVASPNEAPCRHCLTWAKAGERVVLFPYTSIAQGWPYAETGPILVHLNPCERYRAIDKFPQDFCRGRALRAYDSAQNMIAGEVVNGTKPESTVEKLLENPETAFVQVRSADRGCYTFRIERV